MNPLDLPGPSFLVFYALFALVVLSVLYVVRSSAETGAAPGLDASDPYLIAYLRGGPFEALRVATVTLIDRGLLGVDDKTAWVKRRVRVQNLKPPIERALTEFFSSDRAAKEIFDSAANVDLREACADYERRLTALDLLPGSERRAARTQQLTVALALLIGLAGAKVFVALSRGRSNVAILVILTVIACFTARRLARPFRTARGTAVLADLRRLFARLRTRGRSLQAKTGNADAALLAAVFGLGALPAPAFGYARKLYPRRASGDSGSGACGSSCGSGCGDGCGGGGGGGGGGD